MQRLINVQQYLIPVSDISKKQTVLEFLLEGKLNISEKYFFDFLETSQGSISKHQKLVALFVQWDYATFFTLYIVYVHSFV